MSLTQFNRSEIANVFEGDVLEKLILENDVSKLNSIQKVQYVTILCKTLSLNPLTQPIKIMRLSGKEQLYATKDCTEQLRKMHNVSITNIKTEMMDGGLYVVTATAKTQDGREDTSTGAVSISGLKGEMLANILMKAETKAKRRVTLSICGLGILDETEVESIQGAVKLEIKKEEFIKLNYDEQDLELYYSDFMKNIEEAKSIDDLQRVFMSIKKVDFRSNPQLLKNLVDAKDKKKLELSYPIDMAS